MSLSLLFVAALVFLVLWYAVSDYIEDRRAEKGLAERDKKKEPQ